jgi:putative two-component system response regulator
MPGDSSIRAPQGRIRSAAATTGTVGHAAAGGTGAHGFTDLELAVRAATLVESAGDAVIGVRLDGLITSWGEGARRMFDYIPAEVLGRHVSLLAPPELSAQPDRLMQEALNAGRVEPVETVRVARDGRRLAVMVSNMAVTDRDGHVSGMLGLYRDITRQRDAETHLMNSERRYRSVVEALTEGVVVMDLSGRVLSANRNAEALMELHPDSIKVGDQMSGGHLIDEHGATLATEELPSFICMRTGLPQEGVVLGLMFKGELARWLTVNSTPLLDHATGQQAGVVTSLTDITAQRRSIEELQRERVEDLERLARVAEYRDDDTFRHTERVGRLAEQLAADLGVDTEVTQTLRRAAPLHDVGKIGIADAILHKPDALTSEEFAIVKTHTTIGETMLANSHAPVLRMGAEIASTHHERWDGAGYPAGLHGNDIPIAGRIVAVADSFDAITHARPYRSAAPVKEAVVEIERCAGGQFDPDVVAAFRHVEYERFVDFD